MRFEKIMIRLAVLMLLIIPTSQALYAYSGVVTVDNIQVEAGDKAELEVRLSNNDMPIAGIVIPMYKTGNDVTIDSISFEGYMASSDFFGSVSPAGPIEDSFEISILPVFGTTPSIIASQGLLATIHITVSPTAFDSYIPIDTFYTVDSLPLPGGGFVIAIKQINASDPSGLYTYFPDYVSGSITIGSPTDVNDNDNDFDKGLPSSFALGQNYPNPFNPSTVIQFALPEASQVRLEVFNILGQSVEVLVDSHMSAGIHQVTYEAGKNPSGVYFYRLTHNEGVETKKMTLLK